MKAVAVLILGLIGAHAATPAEITNALVLKWTAILGSVPFAEERLFACMTYLQPQPEEAFRPFTTEKMSERYSLELGVYGGELFKSAFNDALTGVKPSKYYLNGGRDEPSLLRYEFELDGHRIVMLENFNVFFLIVKPRDFSANKPMDSQVAAELISKWIAVRETNQIEVAQKFKLPGQLRVGDVFTNRTQPDVARILGGQDHVIGFISKLGICLMVFKAQEGRAAMDFPVDYNWVNRQIFEADGTTLVEPPSKPQPVSLPKAPRPNDLK